jgi:hypothetical protein
MNSFHKLVAKMAIVSLISVAPLMAQINNGMDFTTTFPFYAGNVRMPAGSYRITQADLGENQLLIEGKVGKIAAFLQFIPTQSEQPHASSDVTFHRYGGTDYLNRLWVEGQQYGLKVEPTKMEKQAAEKAGVVEHTVSASKR